MSNILVTPAGDAIQKVHVVAADGSPISPTAATAMQPNPVLISTGQVSYASTFSMSGFSDVIGATEVVIERQPTSISAITSAGVSMTIESSASGDAGKVVYVEALGPNYSFLAPFTVTLNGTTKVNIGTLTRINAFYSLVDITGNLSIKSTSGGTPLVAYSKQGSYQMGQGRYTVPSGRSLYAQTIYASISKMGDTNTFVTFYVRQKAASQSTYGTDIAFSVARDGAPGFVINQDFPSRIKGPADIEMTSLAGYGIITVSAYMSGYVIDDSIVPGPSLWQE